MFSKIAALLLITSVLSLSLNAQKPVDKSINIIDVAKGWSANSINTVIFRKNSLTSYKNVQFVSFYNADGFVVIGKRKHGKSKWQLSTTQYKGDVADAHKSISIAIDGDGFVHMAWNQHNNPLQYCRSVTPLSLELTAMMPMTNDAEKKVSYPEFYNMPDGNLLFFYRDGGSGNGNMHINLYNTVAEKWSILFKR